MEPLWLKSNIYAVVLTPTLELVFTRSRSATKTTTFVPKSRVNEGISTNDKRNLKSPAIELPNSQQIGLEWFESILHSLETKQ